jgi:hypothetical protein
MFVVYVRFSVCVVLCLGRGLATSWSLAQALLPSVNDQETEKSAPCSKVGARGRGKELRIALYENWGKSKSTLMRSECKVNTLEAMIELRSRTTSNHASSSAAPWFKTRPGVRLYRRKMFLAFEGKFRDILKWYVYDHFFSILSISWNCVIIYHFGLGVLVRNEMDQSVK